MSGPAVQVLKRFGAVEDDQRYTRLVEMFTDDAIYYDPFFGPQEGKAAIQTFMEHMEEMVPKSGARFDEWVVEGDTTCGWATWIMVARGADGQEVPVPGQSLYRLRDGKVSFVADHVDNDAYRRLRGEGAKSPNHKAAIGLSASIPHDVNARASSSNDVLDRFWSTQDGGRYSELAELFSTDARFVDKSYGTFEGQAAIADFMKQMEVDMPASNATFTRVDQAADDTVGWTQWWCDRPGGRIPGWTLHTFDNGKIAFDADFFDTDDAKASRASAP